MKKLKQLALNEEDFQTVVRTEVDALEAMRMEDSRHLVKAVAYYTKGKNHCIVFPWARRGNLRDFWKSNPPKLDSMLLEWAFTQLCGLAEAIRTLHHSQKDKALRHGDLKPENILCFDDPKKKQSDDLHSCILVIADVGLSRTHDKVTELRKGATRTKSGTIKYEPPETELQPNEPRSRRYDVWSLGCIYFEFMIWLLYGPEELKRFRDDLESLGENTRFYLIEEDPNTRQRTARLNGIVQKWIDWIRKDQRCPDSTAMRRLLDLIVERLLVADVGPARHILPRRTTTFSNDNESYAGPSTPSILIKQPTVDFRTSHESAPLSRATAKELYENLDSIIEEATSEAAERVDWIDQTAPAQQGPGRFGERLDTSDSIRNLQVG